MVEDPVPEFGALLGSFSKFFEARRPLRPERKTVKRRVKDQVKEPKIIVSIRNAQNLPVRVNKYDEEVSYFFVRKHLIFAQKRHVEFAGSLLIIVWHIALNRKILLQRFYTFFYSFTRPGEEWPSIFAPV